MAADLKTLKGVSEQDRKMIADAEALLGPEPSAMGFVKNLFWGNFRQELIFPYPKVAAEERPLVMICSPGSIITSRRDIPRWKSTRSRKSRAG